MNVANLFGEHDLEVVVLREVCRDPADEEAALELLHLPEVRPALQRQRALLAGPAPSRLAGRLLRVCLVGRGVGGWLVGQE